MDFSKYENKLPYPDRSEKDFKAMRQAYRDNEQVIVNWFKADLLAEFGVSGPKADKCFELAWSHGHAAGLQDVAQYFEEFVELIK